MQLNHVSVRYPWNRRRIGGLAKTVERKKGNGKLDICGNK